MLEDVLREELDKRKTPGVAVTLIEDGVPSATVCAGSRGDDRPVTARTIFEAASMSKPVTAYVALRLVDEGRLDLDKPLVSYMSARWVDDPRINVVTARHAMTHQTGLWRDSSDAPPYFERDPSIDFKYSNAGVEYLQAAIEEITGEDLEAFAQGMIFAPLGMTDTSFVWRDEYEETTATPHDENGKPLEKWRPDAAWGPGGVHTTAPDYASFVAAVPSLNTEWLRPQIEVHEAWGAGGPLPGSTWGLGWGLQADASFWHWGWNVGFLSFAVAWPEHRRGLVAFTNGNDGMWICKAAVRWLSGRDHPAFHWLEH